MGSQLQHMFCHMSLEFFLLVEVVEVVVVARLCKRNRNIILVCNDESQIKMNYLLMLLKLLKLVNYRDEDEDEF